jgi:hypothetical protein
MHTASPPHLFLVQGQQECLQAPVVPALQPLPQSPQCLLAAQQVSEMENLLVF